MGARSYSLNTLNFQRSSGDCLCIYYRELSTLGLATQAGGCSCIYRELPPFGLSRSGGGDRTTSAGLDGRHRLDQAPPMNDQNRLASPELTELSIGVGGMTCATCTGRVERFLRRVPGVAQVRVDLVGERAFIELDPQLTGREELAAAIRAAGYEPRVETKSPLADDDLSLLGRFDDAERRLLNESLFALGVGGAAMIVMIGELMSPLVSWALLIAATLVQFISGRRIYVGALRAARARSSSMETLIAIGTTSAYLSGLLATLAPGLAHSLGLHGGYLEVAPIVLGFVLLGRLIEGRARRRAGDALRALAALRPTLARVLRDGVESSLPVASIRVGDLLLVSAGERIPGDGGVVEGAASIDESAVSGESRPLERSGGQPLIGGSTVASGSLTMRATATGAESVLGKMIALVERAQSTKAPIARLADTIAARFVPAVLLFALAVAAFTLLAGPEPRVASALAQTIAILVVACPCALGLATPVAPILSHSTRPPAMMMRCSPSPPGSRQETSIRSVARSPDAPVSSGSYHSPSAHSSDSPDVAHVVSSMGCALRSAAHGSPARRGLISLRSRSVSPRSTQTDRPQCYSLGKESYSRSLRSPIRSDRKRVPHSAHSSAPGSNAGSPVVIGAPPLSESVHS